MLEMCGWLLTSKVESLSSLCGRYQSGRKRHSGRNSLSGSNRVHDPPKASEPQEGNEPPRDWLPGSKERGAAPSPAPPSPSPTRAHSPASRLVVSPLRHALVERGTHLTHLCRIATKL